MRIMTADDNAPEAWYMDSRDDIDQREPHRLEPNEPVCGATLRRLGVTYWKLDADKHEDDPELEKIRADRGYNYQDIITVSKDKLPGYEEKIKIFFEEHIHEDEEIRYVLDGRCDTYIHMFCSSPPSQLTRMGAVCKRAHVHAQGILLCETYILTRGIRHSAAPYIYSVNDRDSCRRNVCVYVRVHSMCCVYMCV